jgi:hypothetical protein
MVYIDYVDGSLSDVVNALKEDMKSELDHLRELYEDQKRAGIEKIREKYLKYK